MTKGRTIDQAKCEYYRRSMTSYDFEAGNQEMRLKTCANGNGNVNNAAHSKCQQEALLKVKLHILESTVVSTSCARPQHKPRNSRKKRSVRCNILIAYFHGQLSFVLFLYSALHRVPDLLLPPYILYTLIIIPFIGVTWLFVLNKVSSNTKKSIALRYRHFYENVRTQNA